MKKLPVLALAAFMLLAAPSFALAEGFGLYEWSARGVALGGATMARSPDASAIASNPAAITRLAGKQVQLGFTGVSPYGKAKFESGPGAGKTYNVKDKIWPVPNMYYTQQVNDKLFLGVGEFSRFGLGFKYPADWGGRYNIYEVSVQSASVNPNVAYKLTDNFSLAFGVEIMYVDITLKKKVDGQLLGLGDIDFDTSTTNWEYGANIALHWQFNDEWAFGAMYRSPLKHKIDGELKVNKTSPIATGLGIKDQDFTATVYMPDSVSFGLSYTPTPRFSVEAGAIYTRWSRFTDLDFTFDDPILGRRLQKNTKNWHNTWRLNIGVEYAVTDWMDLRAGYVWDECPVNDDYADYLIPTNDRNIYSVGVGFKPQNWTIDIAYAFVDPKNRSYSKDSPVAAGGNGTYRSKVKDSGTHIVSLSVGYKF